MTDDVFTLALDASVFLENRGLGRRKDTVEAAQDGERKDDLAVFVPLVGTTQKIADAPDEAGDLGVCFCWHGNVR